MTAAGQLETFPALPEMSVAGGKADVPATWPDSPLLAEGVEKVRSELRSGARF